MSDEISSHLGHMARTRPGVDGQASKWAAARIRELETDLVIANGLVEGMTGRIAIVLQERNDAIAETHATGAEREAWQARAERAEAQIAELTAKLAAADGMVMRTARAVSHAITAASKEHRQKFPHDDYKAANIALGGLRNVGFVIAPDTHGMGNEEAATALAALTPAPEEPTE